MALVSPVPAAISNLPRQDLWVTDGEVYSVLETNGVTYVGGQFGSIAPNAGRGSLVNIYSGQSEPLLPQANGVIFSVVPDGAGGWYVGGGFTRLGGLARTNLARLRSDLTVDPLWMPNPTGLTDTSHVSLVFAMVKVEDALYVGGVFTNIARQARSNLAKLDAATGQALPWEGAVEGRVFALAHVEGRLIAGGEFTRAAGLPRENLAAFDPQTGSAIADWNPGARAQPGQGITALASDGEVLFVGGYFDLLAGQSRTNLGAVDLMTGAATGWNPPADDGVHGLAYDCNTVYAVGLFTNIAGVTRRYAAAIDALTGQATPWNPDANDRLLAVQVSGNLVYVGGVFTEIGGATRDSLAALDKTTGMATPWNPKVNRGIASLAVAGNHVYAGGLLSSGGLKRGNLAAFDTRTGMPLDWNPGVNGLVYALAASSTTLYVGGNFTEAGGLPRERLAAIDLVDGQVLAWRADAAGLGDDTTILAMALGPNELYVGGIFIFLNGDFRFGVGSVNASNGQLTSFNPMLNGWVYAMDLTGNSLFLGGNFSMVRSSSRPYLAEVLTDTGSPTSWAPAADFAVTEIKVDHGTDTVFLGGFFTTLNGVARHSAGAVTRSGTLTPWNPDLAGTLPFGTILYDMHVSSNSVFLGGYFDSVQGQTRKSLAEVDKATGAPTSFHPGLGDYRATVASMQMTPHGLWVGGVIGTIGEEVRPFLAAFTEDGAPRLDFQPVSLAVEEGGVATFSTQGSGLEPLFYQWQRNGIDLPGATDSILTLSNLVSSDTASYRVVVTNSLGIVTSLEAELNVLQPLVILAQPQSQTSSPGANIELRVDVAGHPAPSFQWRRNGVNIPGAVFDSLLLTNVQPQDGGSYGVIVANNQSALSSDIAQVVVLASPLPLANNLTNRSSIEGASGTGMGSNAGASLEPGEKPHAGKPGGASVWISWTAPADGIVVFDTLGSTIDTLLAVYTGNQVDDLTETASNDDAGGYKAGLVAFNAKSGVEYLIAIDGLAGATGNLVLRWTLDTVTVEFPRILTQPSSKSVEAGQTVQFTVKVSSPSPVRYQWFEDCRELLHETNDTLNIVNAQPVHVGVYRVLIMNDSTRIAASEDVFLEIGPVADFLSQDKREDLAATLSQAGMTTNAPKEFPSFATAALSGPAPILGVGSINSQILDNAKATADPREIHCGTIGGSSKWIYLLTQDGGTCQLDTLGSQIDTVLAVYTNLIPEVYFSDLILVDCDDNGAVDGIRSQLQFEAGAGLGYWVAVDGVNGAVGTVYLNWRMDIKPVVLNTYTSQTARAGSSLTLTLVIGGAVLPVDVQWMLNGQPLPGQTDRWLRLDDFQLSHAGTYSVMVSNFAGVVTKDIARLDLDIPIIREVVLVQDPGGNRLRLTGLSDQPMTIQVSSNLVDWDTVFMNLNPGVPFEYDDSDLGTLPRKFYRAIPWPP